MLILIDSMKELNSVKLAKLYEESLLSRGREEYPDLPMGLQLLQAEQDLFDYLREDFFPNGGRYAVLQEAEDYLAALRLVPYNDGWLLAGLETAPAFRRKGYAKKLICAILETLGQSAVIYSHIHKKNIPSLNLHRACGFYKLSDSAVLLDGSASHKICTLVYRTEN